MTRQARRIARKFRTGKPGRILEMTLREFWGAREGTCTALLHFITTSTFSEGRGSFLQALVNADHMPTALRITRGKQKRPE
jgi:hypothetical protein